MLKIITIPFDIAEASGIVAAAKKDRVTIKDGDTIFAVQGIRAVACVRFIRRKLARLCGCWVAKEHRGQGVGTALVKHRIDYIQNHTGALAIDTYAFNNRLFIDLGFEERAGFKIGTTLFRKQIARGQTITSPDKQCSLLIKPPVAATKLGESLLSEVWVGSFYGVQLAAQMLAVDPPWRQGNLSYWSHKVGTEQVWDTFVNQMQAMVINSGFRLVYIKCGVPDAHDWRNALESIGMKVVCWETTYYAGKNAQVLASNSLPIETCPQLPESKEATTAIAKWAALQQIETAADVCVGLGKMLKKFQAVGMRVVGIELNPDRAAVAAKRLGIVP